MSLLFLIFCPKQLELLLFQVNQDALDKAQDAFADPKKYGLDFSAFNPMKTVALS